MSTPLAATSTTAGSGCTGYTARMDRLWTPWRYAYISEAKAGRRAGVPDEFQGYPRDDRSVFLNMIGSVRWAYESGGFSRVFAEKAGGILFQSEHNFVCLNAFPYSSGHVMVVPYLHLDSLAKLPLPAAEELMLLAQRMETVLREVYRPDGINLGMNLGEAAGAGIAEHLHLHILPRWFGDSNFMTTTAETRVLPESLNTTWERLRTALKLPLE